MRKLYRIISLIIILCLVANNTVFGAGFDSAKGQVKGQDIKSSLDKLAVSSIFDDPDKETANIEYVLQENLLSRKQDILDMASLKEDLVLKEKSVFRPFNMNFLFSSMQLLTDEYIWVKCRVIDEKEEKQVNTYHVVFSRQKDKDQGFPIEVYTEEEWKRLEKHKKTFDEKNVVPPFRRGKGLLAKQRYTKINEAVIDRFIRERIEEGNFIEIENRAKNLGWDEDYPDREKPGTYWSEDILDSIKEPMCRYLKFFGKDCWDKALGKKNIVFIKIPQGEDYPVIQEQGQDMKVMSHASEKAGYVFLTHGQCDAIQNFLDAGDIKDSDTFNRSAMREQIFERIAYEIGVIYDFPFKFFNSWYGREKPVLVMRNAVQSAMMSFYLKYEQTVSMFPQSYEPMRKKVLEQFPEITALQGDSVNLNDNIMTRDYSMGFWPKWLKRKTPAEKNRKKFLDKKFLIVQKLSEDPGLTQEIVQKATEDKLESLTYYELILPILDDLGINDLGVTNHDQVTCITSAWSLRTNREEFRGNPIIDPIREKIEQRAWRISEWKIEKYGPTLGKAVIARIPKEMIDKLFDEELDTSKPTGYWVNDHDFNAVKEDVDGGVKGKGIAYITRIAREARLAFEMIVALRRSAEQKDSKPFEEWFTKTFDRVENGDLTPEIVEQNIRAVAERLSNKAYPDIGGIKLEDVFMIALVGEYLKLDKEKGELSEGRKIRKQVIDSLFKRYKNLFWKDENKKAEEIHADFAESRDSVLLDRNKTAQKYWEGLEKDLGAKVPPEVTVDDLGFEFSDFVSQVWDFTQTIIESKQFKNEIYAYYENKMPDVEYNNIIQNLKKLRAGILSNNPISVLGGPVPADIKRRWDLVLKPYVGKRWFSDITDEHINIFETTLLEKAKDDMQKQEEIAQYKRELKKTRESAEKNESILWRIPADYIYVKILEATKFWENNIDPYVEKKHKGCKDGVKYFAENLNINKIKEYEKQGEEGIRKGLAEMLDILLLGNMYSDPTHKTQETKDEMYLVNDKEKVLEYLMSLRKRTCEGEVTELHILHDNVGVELVALFWFMDFCIRNKVIKKVVMHTKNHPYCISDVTGIRDVEMQLRALASFSDEMKTFCERITEHIYKTKKIVVAEAHWFPAMGQNFADMSQDYYDQLAKADLIMAIGDFWYRKMYLHRQWDYTADSKKILKYFPAPVVVVRIGKSPMLAGVKQNIREMLTKIGKLLWWEKPKYGLVDFVGPEDLIKQPGEKQSKAVDSLREKQKLKDILESGHLKDVDVILSDFDGVDRKEAIAGNPQIPSDRLIKLKRDLAETGILNCTLTSKRQEQFIEGFGGMERIKQLGARRPYYTFTRSTGKVMNKDGQLNNIPGYEPFILGEDEVAAKLKDIAVSLMKEVLKENDINEAVADKILITSSPCEGISLYVNKDEQAHKIRYKIAERIRNKIIEMQGKSEIFQDIEVTASFSTVNIMPVSKGKLALWMIKKFHLTSAVIIADFVGTDKNPGNDRSLLGVTQKDLLDAGIDWPVKLFKFYVGNEANAELPEGVIRFVPDAEQDAPALDIYQEILKAKHIRLAEETAFEIAPPVLEKKYTLFASYDFFENKEELEKDQIDYGSVFMPKWIKSNNPGVIMQQVEDEIEKGLDPKTIIIQLPGIDSDKTQKIEEFKSKYKDIKFLVIDVQGLKGEDEIERPKYRRIIYSLMLLARTINKDTAEDSKLYQLLRIFIDTCFKNVKDRNEKIDAYLQALKFDKIMEIIKTVLSYKFIEKHVLPNRDITASTLISL
ncbi:MAG: ARMT1-like domain-containing protein [Candidatus Omnitrophota bacterium]